MEEARLSMVVQKKINYHLRNGDPLPTLETLYPVKTNQTSAEEKALDIMRRARIAKRKSLNSIIASGAYEQPLLKI